jgi:hypothetical protein
VLACLGAVNLYIGIGLLRLQEFARRLAFAWLIFGCANMAVIAAVPGSVGRMMEESSRWIGQPLPAFSMPWWLLLLPGLLVNGAIALLLVRNRAAFGPQAVQV